MANSKKVWRGRELYERLVAEREREGLTWGALSERSGVPISTLHEWGRRLREESTPAFLSLGSVAVAEPVFEVDQAGGRRVRVPPHRAVGARRRRVMAVDPAKTRTTPPQRLGSKPR